MGTSLNDLDLMEFERLRRMVRERLGGGALLSLGDEQLVRCLGIARRISGHLVLTVAGLLLLELGQVLREDLPSHEVTSH